MAEGRGETNGTIVQGSALVLDFNDPAYLIYKCLTIVDHIFLLLVK